MRERPHPVPRRVSDPRSSPQLYLASRSPRRAEGLRLLGLDFETLPADVPEVPEAGQSPLDYARRLAQAKARAAAGLAAPGVPVLGADTDVSIDGEILGKPCDAGDAVAMLLRLSGRRHQVISAVTVVLGAREETITTATAVEFGEIDPLEARAYAASGEPLDKAGAYAIQGYAGRWVRRLEGSYSGVVGLPLYETAGLLARFGIRGRRAGAR